VGKTEQASRLADGDRWVRPTLVRSTRRFDDIAGSMWRRARRFWVVTSRGRRTPDTTLYEIVLAHEGFHALQQLRGFARLMARLGHATDPLDSDDARAALREAESRPEVAELLRRENALLERAMDAQTPAERTTSARAWLEARRTRRQATPPRRPTPRI
jgi:hypothetical protein